MHWVLVANGTFQSTPHIVETLDNADVLVGVDGGGVHLQRLQRTPDIVLGDMDSIAPEVLQQYREADVTMHLHPSRKDATDLELAIDLAADQGATRLTILGATGGRPDHALGNLFLLQLCANRHLPASVLSADGATYLIADALALHGHPGDILSLIPLTPGARGVTLKGLEYPLHDATLPFGTTRGISNLFVGTHVTIQIKAGLLLVFHLYMS